MKIKATFKDLSNGVQGTTLALQIDKDSVFNLRRAFNEKELDGELSVEIKKWRNTRSLNANAYFHTLVNKIAEKLNASDSEVKIRLNLEYGKPAVDNGGNPVVIKLPKDVDIKQFYDYSKWIADKKEPSGIETSYYMLYKQTHTLDTKEMARLIDGTIQEAQQIGIETISPAEKEKMMKLYGVDYEKQANKGS